MYASLSHMHCWNSISVALNTWLLNRFKYLACVYMLETSPLISCWKVVSINDILSFSFLLNSPSTPSILVTRQQLSCPSHPHSHHWACCVQLKSGNRSTGRILLARKKDDNLDTWKLCYQTGSHVLQLPFQLIYMDMHMHMYIYIYIYTCGGVCVPASLDLYNPLELPMKWNCFYFTRETWDPGRLHDIFETT